MLATSESSQNLVEFIKPRDILLRTRENNDDESDVLVDDVLTVRAEITLASRSRPLFIRPTTQDTLKLFPVSSKSAHTDFALVSGHYDDNDKDTAKRTGRSVGPP